MKNFRIKAFPAMVLMSFMFTILPTVSIHAWTAGENNLEWMRSIESENAVFVTEDISWDYDEALTLTPLKYFENNSAYNGALNQESKGSECISGEEPIIDVDHIWDKGTYFDKYKNENGDVSYSWASWQHLGVDGDKDNTQYSIRRFSAYVDISESEYNNIGTAILAPSDELGNMSYLLPVNDTAFVFVNGALAYWGGTDVEGGSNQYGAENRVFFDGVKGIKLRDGVNSLFKNIYPHTDGWCIDLDVNKDRMDIKSLLKPGFNRIDIFADDFWEGGGMNKINLYVENKGAELSPGPNVDPIYEDTWYVAGSGIQGAIIEITFPQGNVITTRVSAKGRWVVDVEECNKPFIAGSIIYVTQICDGDGLLPSEPVAITVLK